MKRRYFLLASLLAAGCADNMMSVCKSQAGQGHGHGRGERGGIGARMYGQPPYGAQHDRPFPVGQVSDSFWEAQQTNAEAADFIFHDMEFVGNTAQLTPGGKKHLEQVALRFEHVPFPVLVEQTEHNARPELDKLRRKTLVEQLGRLGITNHEERVVIANSFAEGFTGIEGERAYYGGILSGRFGGGMGRRFGGAGGMYR